MFSEVELKPKTHRNEAESSVSAVKENAESGKNGKASGSRRSAESGKSGPSGKDAADVQILLDSLQHSDSSDKSKMASDGKGLSSYDSPPSGFSRGSATSAPFVKNEAESKVRDKHEKELLSFYGMAAKYYQLEAIENTKQLGKAVGCNGILQDLKTCMREKPLESFFSSHSHADWGPTGIAF